MHFHRRLEFARLVAVLCVALVLPGDILMAFQPGRSAPQDKPLHTPRS